VLESLHLDLNVIAQQETGEFTLLIEKHSNGRHCRNGEKKFLITLMMTCHERNISKVMRHFSSGT
jgi:hypothetical protein